MQKVIAFKKLGRKQDLKSKDVKKYRLKVLRNGEGGGRVERKGGMRGKGIARKSVVERTRVDCFTVFFIPVT